MTGRLTIAMELIEARREIARLKEELAKAQKQLEMERTVYVAVADLLRQAMGVIRR